MYPCLLLQVCTVLYFLGFKSYHNAFTVCTLIFVLCSTSNWIWYEKCRYGHRKHDPFVKHLLDVEFLRSTFFSSTALTAQMAQTEFKFQNVAYWPTVYRTGRSSNSFMSFNSNNRPITGGTKSWSFPVYCLFCLKRQNLICIFVQFLSLC